MNQKPRPDDLIKECDAEFNMAIVLASIFIFSYIFFIREITLLAMAIACAVFSVGIRKQRKEIILETSDFYGSI